MRYGLGIGSVCAPMVLALMWIMCPVAWPTAKLLDYLLGEDHGTMYKKAGLKTLVQLHKTLGTTTGERLMEDEVTIINSVLDLKEKAVGDIMTPMQDVSAVTGAGERLSRTEGGKSERLLTLSSMLLGLHNEHGHDTRREHDGHNSVSGLFSHPDIHPG